MLLVVWAFWPDYGPLWSYCMEAGQHLSAGVRLSFALYSSKVSFAGLVFLLSVLVAGGVRADLVVGRRFGM